MKGFIIKCSRWGERICRKGVPGQGHTVLIEATWWRGAYWNCSGQVETVGDGWYWNDGPLRVGDINVEFETSYEPSGPFGVKSIGEIVINTPAPALAHAIYRATGVWHRTVPFTPEKILMGMVDPNWHEKDLRVK